MRVFLFPVEPARLAVPADVAHPFATPCGRAAARPNRLPADLSSPAFGTKLETSPQPDSWHGLFLCLILAGSEPG